MTSDAVDDGLRPAGAYASLGAYLSQLWRRRSYIVHVPRQELRSRNMNTALGSMWHLLNPALSILIYFVIFGVVLDITRGVEYYIAYLSIGVMAFTFTQKSITSASATLARNGGLMRSVSFPRAMLPMTTVTTELLTYLPGIALFLIVTVLNGAPVRITWLLLPALVVVQYVFNVGAGLIAARLNHTFRDIENILPFIFRLLFYGSGVLFYVGAYVEDPALRWFFYVNPVFCILTLYRWAVLGMPADMIEVASLAIWTAVVLVGGLWWFRRGEASYGN